MKLLKIKIETAEEAEEALSEYLTNMLLATGVEVRRRSDFLAAENRHTGEVVDFADIQDVPEDIQVIGYFTEKSNSVELKNLIVTKLAELRSYNLRTGSGEITASFVQDSDWNESWKKFYHVVHVTHDLTVVPEWIEYEKKDTSEQLIRLDPGLSFGTGTHTTTQLALLAIEKVLRPGMSILDVGTGSGILSLAAEKLGAREILATDIDEHALTAAKANLKLNDSTHIKLVESNLLANVSGKFDLIIANILTEVLLLLIPDMMDYLTENGQIIMSGIDIEQLPKLKEAFLKYNFTVKLQLQEDRWLSLIIEPQKD